MIRRPAGAPCSAPIGPVFATVTLAVPTGNGLVRKLSWRAPLAGLDTEEGQADLLGCLSSALVLAVRDIAHTAHGTSGSA